MSRNAAFHEVWGRTAFAGESAPVVELYGVGSLSATVCRGRIHGRTTGYGATYAFSLRPLSVFSARTGLIGKDGNGSRPCENSGTFSHGPISFAFSSPETVQRRRNYGNLRSARPVGKFRGVLTRPRSTVRIAATAPREACVQRTPRGRESFRARLVRTVQGHHRLRFQGNGRYFRSSHVREAADRRPVRGVAEPSRSRA